MTFSESIGNAPSGLQYLAAFSRSERALVAANPALLAKLRAAAPSAWRTLFDTDRKEARSRLPRHPDAAGAPMRRQALHDLDAEMQALASLHDDRRNAVYRAGARLARYWANGILTEQEIEAGLIEAWQASGAVAKSGLDYPRGAIRRGLNAGRNDPLPPLMNRFRNPGRAAP
jgi:hypothetical protein